VAWYGDTDLGGTLTLDDQLTAAGRLNLLNLDFDGEVWIGWFDAEDSPDRTDFVGLQFREPNGDTNPDFRGLASFYTSVGSYNVGNFVAVPEDTQYEFLIEYDPDQGDGELTITLTDTSSGDTITQTNFLTASERAEDAELNAFGITTSGGAGSNVPTQLMELYIDDLTYTSLKSSVPGDFDGNGLLDQADIDDLTTQSASTTHPPKYDLNGDTQVDEADVRMWVKELFQSWVGDANLDKEFNSSDLVGVLASGTYEADVAAVWSTGDFNGDGRTNSSDLVAALADGGYELGPPPPAVAAVPEPSTLLLLGIAIPLILARRRRGDRGAVDA
jgi:hypothetical protein